MKINISEDAKTQLEEQLKSQDIGDKALRLYVSGHG